MRLAESASATALRRRGAVRALTAVLAPVAVALLLAACGGSSTPGVANLDRSASHNSSGAGSGSPSSLRGPLSSRAVVADELTFSECMRANGEPDFPDPNANGGYTIQGNSNDGLGPNGDSPQALRAESKCRKYSWKAKLTPAQQAQMLAQAVKFAECMRAHGEPDFADPGANGATLNGTKIDKNSPIFQRAQSACASDMPVSGGSSG